MGNWRSSTVRRCHIDLLIQLWLERIRITRCHAVSFRSWLQSSTIRLLNLFILSGFVVCFFCNLYGYLCKLFLDIVIIILGLSLTCPVKILRAKMTSALLLRCCKDGNFKQRNRIFIAQGLHIINHLGWTALDVLD